jgi:hypothetical protein
MEERNIGDWKIRVRYEDCQLDYCHRYWIELVDLKHWVLITIDSNVIDKISSMSLDEAVLKAKGYMKIRFGFDLVL